MKNALGFLILAALFACGSPPALRVATYNIASERWPERRELVLGAIRSFDPDVLGVQEASIDSLHYLCVNLPDYQTIVAANPGGELVPIYVRRSIEISDVGFLWYSSTPDVASDDWPVPPGQDHAGPRMIAKVRLANGETILNTHIGGDQIEPSLAMLSAQAESIEGPKIVIGDFNDITTDANPWGLKSHESILTDVGLVDSFHELNPTSTEPGGCDFEGPCVSFGFDSRIDYVYRSKGLRAIRAFMPNPRNGNTNASDHRPVVVDFEK